jgi:uroporphyrinogen decarboxylase
MAKNLAGGDVLIAHIRQYPEAVLKGLETIAESTRRFVEACVETNIDGIFYAIQHAQAGLLTRDEFRTFSLVHDRAVLEPARSLWCNLLHLHGLNVYFDLLPSYCSLFTSPLIVNWHDRETPPSLAEAQTSDVVKTSGVTPVLCGGVSQHSIVFADSTRVREEAVNAIKQTQGRRFVLGTGCVVPVIAPYGNIQAVAGATHESFLREK